MLKFTHLSIYNYRKMSDLFQIQSDIQIITSENKLIRKYELLHHVKANQFTVICCNFYDENSTSEHYHQLEKQTHELLLGFSPLEREWFSTIEQAIQAHDEDFVL